MKFQLGKLDGQMVKSDIAYALENGYAGVQVTVKDTTSILHLLCQYKDDYILPREEQWRDCRLAQATRVFISWGPSARSTGNKVGTYYPASGLFVEARNARKHESLATLALFSNLFGTNGGECVLLSTDPDKLIEIPTLLPLAAVTSETDREHVSAESVAQLRKLFGTA